MPRRPYDPDHPKLLDLEAADQPLKFKNLTGKVWSKYKAQLVRQYIYYFILVTKNCTYIDGFAGPQQEHKPDTWTASLVLGIEPRWITKFHLFEEDPIQYQKLRELWRSAPSTLRSRITLYPGDVNKNLPAFLAKRRIREKQATFCLLDQRTFECDWATVESVAYYKTQGRKIEIFYFLANNWLPRSLAAVKDDATLLRWWGRDDWSRLCVQGSYDRAAIVCDRFQRELGYRYATPWAIFQDHKSPRIMYFMIHATDHPAAPMLMRRAYEHMVRKVEVPVTQLRFELLKMFETAESEASAEANLTTAT
jgi:three-Cys-motif partner protein